MVKTTSDEIIHGLYGTFYEKPLFEEFLLGSYGDHEGGDLHFMSPKSFQHDLDEKAFQSARWVGKIKIPASGRYLFNTSDKFGRVCIQLHESGSGKVFDVIMEGKRSAPQLNEGIYHIIIEYIPLTPILDNQSVLKLYWRAAGTANKDLQSTQVIPKEYFQVADDSAIKHPMYITKHLFKHFHIPNPKKSPTAGSFYDSSADPTLLSESVLNRLKQSQQQLKSDDGLSRKQIKLWDEARHSPLKYRRELLKEEKEAEEADIKKGIDFEERKVKTWEALYWDPERKEKDSTKDKKLDPNFDYDNPLAKNVDTDQDGIMNDLSTNGFVVHLTSIKPWRKSYENSNYTKYRCSYYKPSTAGDPFLDSHKVLGHVSNVLPVTRNPLVAACPCVSAEMEGYSISQLKDITVSAEHGFHATTSNRLTVSTTQGSSVTNENSENVTGSIGMSGKLPTVQGGGNLGWSRGLSKDESNTNTVESSSDSTNISAHTFQQHWNTGTFAYLNAYVRYANTGTASILKARPSMNFGVYDKNEKSLIPMVSVAPVENSASEALNLQGDSFYPSKDLMPIVIQTQDSFNASRITINQEQFESIVAGNPMKLEVPQVKGEFEGKINSAQSSFVPNIQKDYQWTPMISNINDNTARLTLVTPDGKIYERRIAAPKVSEKPEFNELGQKNKQNYVDLYADIDKVPLLKIGEAIQVAFCKNQKGFALDHDIEYSLQRADVNLILDEKTHRILREQYKERLKQDKENNTKTIGNYYDLDLYQGMRIIIEVPPVITLSLSDKSSKDVASQGKFILQNHFTNKTIHYTVTLSPEKSVARENGERKQLTAKGTLKPGEKTPLDLKIITDQDIVRVYIGETSDEMDQKLMFEKNVTKFPGFVRSKPVAKLEDVQKAYEFSSWIGDRTQKSKCTGIQLFIYPKEHWDTIASFMLQIKKQNGTELTYGPVLKTQLVAGLEPEKETKDGKEGYKVSLDFSLFKGLDTQSIQLGDKITLTGKLNEIPKRSWDQITTCSKENKDACDMSKLYLPYQEPRTCILLNQKEFMPKYTIENYKEAFSSLQFATVQNVPSVEYPEKVTFPSVYTSLTCTIKDPLILATIIDYEWKFTKAEKSEFIKKPSYQIQNGKIEFNFHTDKTITKNEEEKDTLPGPLKLAARIGDWITGGDGSFVKHHTYNVSVAGLFPGKHVEIVAVVDPRVFSHTAQIEKTDRISILDKSI